MNEDEQNIDPYFGGGESLEPEPLEIDLDALTEEQRHQIALKYALQTGEFIPRSMMPGQPEPQAPVADPADEWEPMDGESVKDYTKRMMARERQTMREELLKETGQRFGAGATHAAAEMLTRTVENSANMPEAAKPYLREIIPGLLKANPALANGLDELGIQQLTHLAIGRAYAEGKLQVGTPSTQREDFIPTPRGTDLAPGIDQTVYESSIRMWQELRDYPRDEKTGALLRPSPAELRDLGVIR